MISSEIMLVSKQLLRTDYGRVRVLEDIVNSNIVDVFNGLIKRRVIRTLNIRSYS